MVHLLLHLRRIMNKKIIIDNKKYELIENYKDAYSKEEVEKRYTEYFEPYDYILGDYSYGSLRLKGFCEKRNKIFKPYNDIKKYKEYLKNECSYECRYFIIKKIKEDR